MRTVDAFSWMALSSGSVDDVGEALDLRRAEVALLDAEHFLAVGRRERAAAPIDVPQVAARRVHADDVDDVAFAANPSRVAGGDDLRRAGEPVRGR